MAADVVSLQAGILAENGSALPFSGTEGGWLTDDTAGELVHARADIRENLIMLGEGATLNMSFYIVDNSYIGDGYSWAGYYYNLDPGHNYDASKICPRPAAPAYAASSFFIDGSDATGVVENLSDGNMGYGFVKGDVTTLALWTFDTDNSISVAVGTDAIAYDWMGNALPTYPVGGRITVALTEEPVYIQYTTLTRSPDLPAASRLFAKGSSAHPIPQSIELSETIPI